MSDIKQNTQLSDVLKKYPGTKKVVKKLNLDCLSCKGIRAETILEAARNHGLDPDYLVDELRKAAD